MNLLTQANFTFFVSLISIIFGVYLYFRKPQEMLEKKQALDNQDTENKAELLRQKAELQSQYYERSLKEIRETVELRHATNVKAIHDVDTKVERLDSKVGGMSNELTRLATIIEERIPKK